MKPYRRHAIKTRSKSPRPVWNSLEISKLVVSMATPIMIGLLAAYVSTKSSRDSAEAARATQLLNLEWQRDQALYQKRVALWEPIDPQYRYIANNVEYRSLPCLLGRKDADISDYMTQQQDVDESVKAVLAILSWKAMFFEPRLSNLFDDILERLMELDRPTCDESLFQRRKAAFREAYSRFSAELRHELGLVVNVNKRD